MLLHKVRDTLKETLNEIRNLSHQLAPVTFEGLAFEIAIKQLLQQIKGISKNLIYKTFISDIR